MEKGAGNKSSGGGGGGGGGGGTTSAANYEKEEDSMEFPGWVPTALIVGHSLGEMSIPVIVGNFMAGLGNANSLPLTVLSSACIAFFLFYLLWFITTR